MDPSYACNILNTGIRAQSCIIEVYLKNEALSYHNWSYLIGDEPCSICPLYCNGVNLHWDAGGKNSLFYIITWLEKEVIVGGQCCNTSLLEERYHVWCKHWSDSFWNIKLKIKIKKKLLYKTNVTLDIVEIKIKMKHLCSKICKILNKLGI